MKLATAGFLLIICLMAACSEDRPGRAEWRDHGVRVVQSNELDMNTPQTSGMARAAAITQALVGANKLWAGTVTIKHDVASGAHHHGELESVIYVVSGRAHMRLGGST